MTANITFVSPDGVLVVLLTGDTDRLSIIDGQIYFFSERFGVVKVKKIEYTSK